MELDTPAVDGAPVAPPAPAPAPVAPALSPVDSEPTLSARDAKELKTESQALRKRLRELEAKEEAAAAAKLSETERLQKELAAVRAERETAQAAVRATRIENAVISLASELRLVSPTAAMKLLDLSTLTFDDDGTLNRKSVRAALKDLVEEYPFLLQADPAPAADPPPRPAPGAGSPPTNGPRPVAGTPAPFDPRNPPRLSDSAIFKHRLSG